MADTHYQTLGVARDADADTIKKAYRKLARKYHPDLSKEPDAQERMQAINIAYETLSNAEKKAEYDDLLDHPHGHGGPSNGQGFDSRAYEQQFHYGDDQDFSGFEDLFGRFGTGFGGGNSRNRTQREPQSWRGEDQHASIEVDLQVAYTGATQQIGLDIPTYNAYGQAEIQRKTLQVKIPAGMKQGQSIRLAGQGQAGVNGGDNGDLYIEIHYRTPEGISVDGLDVLVTTHVLPWEAALGGPITVKTPAGELQVNVPAGSQSGKKLRLKGKGIPNKAEAGNLYLVLNVVVPPAINEAQKQAYADLAHAFPNFNPRPA